MSGVDYGKISVVEDKQISKWLIRVRREEQMEHWLWLGIGILGAAIVGVLTTMTITWVW